MMQRRQTVVEIRTVCKPTTMMMEMMTEMVMVTAKAMEMVMVTAKAMEMVMVTAKAMEMVNIQWVTAQK